MRKELTEDERRMRDCLEFFESLLYTCPLDDARYYIINLILALYTGYKIPPYNRVDMYKRVKETGVGLKQPLVLLSRDSQELLVCLANVYDWTNLDPQFLEDLGQNLMDYKQRKKRKGKHEKAK